MKPAEKVGLNNIWLTPEWVLDLVRAYFGGPIPLDPCTEPSNPARATAFFTEETDGLAQSWAGYGGWFVNPPYSLTPEMQAAGITVPPIRLWAAKIHAAATASPEAGIALLLCGARFSTGYWQDHILIPKLRATCFVRGRISFRHGITGMTGNSNNHDSMFYGFNVDPERFCALWEDHGACYEMRSWLCDLACPGCGKTTERDTVKRLRESGKKFTCMGCMVRCRVEELVSV
ncbi:MAG TPA: DNA N-6-adenine-methyltransferase [Thermoleophilia bacterium]|nr:DNA N-6-adenine-methyltransferase [Thermoleophilia bacterium]